MSKRALAWKESTLRMRINAPSVPIMRGERQEVRKRSIDVVVPCGQIMAELMRQQNEEKRQGERQPIQQRCMG